MIFKHWPLVVVIAHWPAATSTLVYPGRCTGYAIPFESHEGTFSKADARPNKKIVIDEYKDIFHGDVYLNAV